MKVQKKTTVDPDGHLAMPYHLHSDLHYKRTTELGSLKKYIFV